MPTCVNRPIDNEDEFDYSLEGIADEACRGMDITFWFKNNPFILCRKNDKFLLARGKSNEHYYVRTIDEAMNLPLFDGKTFVEALANGEIRREFF